MKQTLTNEQCKAMKEQLENNETIGSFKKGRFRDIILKLQIICLSTWPSTAKRASAVSTSSSRTTAGRSEMATGEWELRTK